MSLVSVGDGDTIRVLKPNGEQLTVRLACIDAPETAQGVIASRSTAALRSLLGRGDLVLKPKSIDKYGRTVAELIVSGQNVNVELVRQGAAFVYRKYLTQCDSQAYIAAERDAQLRSRGIWKWGSSVDKPWDFRGSTKN